MPVPLETLVGNILGCIQVPPPGGPQVRFSIGAGDRQALQPPLSPSLPVTHCSVNLLFHQLGIRNVLVLFCAIMTEQRILFHSKSYNRLTEACRALTALMYPFRYTHVYIPLLPAPLIEVLSTPTPFIMGVHSSLKSEVAELMDVIVADLDGGSIIIPDGISLPLLPEPLLSNTQEALSLILQPELCCADHAFPPLAVRTPQPVMLDKEIRAVFMRTFALLLQGYRSCLTLIRIHPKPVITFHKAAFLGERNLRDCDFTTRVLDCMFFTSFIAERGPPWRPCDVWDELYSNLSELLKTEEQDFHLVLVHIQELATQLYANETPNPQSYAQKILVPPEGAFARIHQPSLPIINAEKVQAIINEGLTKNNLKSSYSRLKYVIISRAASRSVTSRHAILGKLKLDVAYHHIASGVAVLTSNEECFCNCDFKGTRVQIPTMFSTEVGFNKADSGNLPEVDIFMIMDYFNKNKDYVSSEIKGIKLQSYYSLIDKPTNNLEVLRNCINCIFENKISDARKTFPAVLRALQSKQARLALCIELSHHFSGTKAMLEHQQFDLVVRLMNCALQDDSSMDEHGVAAALLPLATIFCRKLCTGIIQFAYTCIQEHAVWQNQQFWEAAFYQDVQKDIKALYTSRTENLPSNKDLLSPSSPRDNKASIGHRKSLLGRSQEITALEIAAEQMRIWNFIESEKQKELITCEENTIYSQAIHYANRMVYLLIPLDNGHKASKEDLFDDERTSNSIANSVAESDSADAESGFEDQDPGETGSNVIKMVSRFIDKVCNEGGVTRDHIRNLHQMIPGVVHMHIETLEAVHRESKRLPPIQKPKILSPNMLAGEESIMEGLRVYLLPDGREEGTAGILGGPPLLPAEGAIFLTNYRIIFKGIPCDSFACEQVVVRAFPVTSLTKEKKVAVQYLAHLDQWLQEGLQLRSCTFQLMKLAFDEEVTAENDDDLSIDDFESGPSSIIPTPADAKTLERLHERSYVRDWQRLGMCSSNTSPTNKPTPDQFRLTAVNSIYMMCRSYPALLVVPAVVTDESIRRFCRCYRQGRIPSITWRHSRTKALLLRGAGHHGKSMMGMLKSHQAPATSTETTSSTEQEKYLAALVAATPIFSHRPLSAWGMSDSSLSIDSLLLAAEDPLICATLSLQKLLEV
ncbi:hypothetical protein NQ317_013334 [Molorchus minor]|uniref:Myotubularin-related protein 13 n=1 Tax=Molorchus minor TaxID=1323400 RepID=A0ABQ9JZX4_9CUCU|nr:hypothetical protein NQ317_013334 [Molorchus minor]